VEIGKKQFFEPKESQLQRSSTVARATLCWVEIFSNAKVDIQSGVVLKIVNFFKCPKLLNVLNYYMYLRFKFHMNSTYDTKVMSQKPPVQRQGDKK